MTLYFITGNENKFEEIKSIIPCIEKLDLYLPEIQSFCPEEIIRKKLNAASKIYPGKDFIVEDTSFYMDALGGFPGPFIKFFLKQNSLEEIYNIAKSRNNFFADAKTIIGYKAGIEGKIQYFEGLIRGEIVSPKVKTKFGWDPIFKPFGYNISFGEMERNEKNKISMRSIAAQKLNEFLKG
jgi:non-canonical purine NTP pyrophosphatase (RdgB/HAM1 family)